MSIAMGWMFKLMHLPGGDTLFTYGFLALALLFLPMLAFDRYTFAVNKVLSEKLKLMLGFASAIVSGIAVAFKLMHLQWADTLLIAGAVLFIFGYLPFLFFSMYRKAVSR
jgi:hypothetical protein